MRIDFQKVIESQARTGKTLAELGIPKTTFANIRKGANVRPQTVYKLAKALGCDVTDLLLKGGEVNG